MTQDLFVGWVVMMTLSFFVGFFVGRGEDEDEE
jgi:hypothetical protein